jgi:hypothetical protein
MTTAVVVDFVLLFEQSQLLVVASFIMVRTTTGMFSSMARTAAFRFFTASPGLIALDVLAFLGFAVAGVSVVVDVYERYELQIPPTAPTWNPGRCAAFGQLGCGSGSLPHSYAQSWS